MIEALQKIQLVLNNDITVLITGESGTGKELAARIIHFQGDRKNKPFVTVNCAASPDTLVESELFGHEKGAFTGADYVRPGKFEAANGGTLFLDEIGDLSFTLQAKLLRILQDKQVTRLGANTPIPVNVRIIAATNHDLQQAVYKGNFREDLYYRLAVYPINLPPLRERGTDILALAQQFLEKESTQGNKTIVGFSPEAEALLLKYSWPGNVRELENAIKRAYILATGDRITPVDLGLTNLIETKAPKVEVQNFANLPRGDQPLQTLDNLEKQIIKERVAFFHGNISQAARSLGITRATLYKKL
jgi:two-component system response regulator HydG